MTSLVRFFLLVLGVVSLGLFFFGGWLLLQPSKSHLLHQPARFLFERFFSSWRIDRWIYRHHRLFGAAIFLGSLFVFMALWSYVGRELPWFQVGIKSQKYRFGSWLWESAVFFLIVASLFTWVMGAIILIRPSALREFESWANRRLDGAVFSMYFERLRTIPARFAQAQPRLFGLLLMLVSGVIVFVFLKWI
ncbi:MAG: hypothetical protein H7832_13720 [Magnetococcus sp. DMHC-6]